MLLHNRVYSKTESYSETSTQTYLKIYTIIQRQIGRQRQTHSYALTSLHCYEHTLVDGVPMEVFVGWVVSVQLLPFTDPKMVELE